MHRARDLDRIKPLSSGHFSHWHLRRWRWPGPVETPAEEHCSTTKKANTNSDRIGCHAKRSKGIDGCASSSSCWKWKGVRAAAVVEITSQFQLPRPDPIGENKTLSRSVDKSRLADNGQDLKRTEGPQEVNAFDHLCMHCSDSATKA